MNTNEKRIQQLIEDPSDDRPLETDAPLIRAGLLHLNWTDRPEGRVHPFVTVSPVAATYLEKNGRLTPAHRRTLKELTKVERGDINWMRERVQPTYNQ